MLLSDKSAMIAGQSKELQRSPRTSQEQAVQARAGCSLLWQLSPSFWNHLWGAADRLTSALTSQEQAVQARAGCSLLRQLSACPEGPAQLGHGAPVVAYALQHVRLQHQETSVCMLENGISVGTVHCSMHVSAAAALRGSAVQ